MPIILSKGLSALRSGFATCSLSHLETHRHRQYTREDRLVRQSLCAVITALEVERWYSLLRGLQTLGKLSSVGALAFGKGWCNSIIPPPHGLVDSCLIEDYNQPGRRLGCSCLQGKGHLEWPLLVQGLCPSSALPPAGSSERAEGMRILHSQVKDITCRASPLCSERWVRVTLLVLIHVDFIMQRRGLRDSMSQNVPRHCSFVFDSCVMCRTMSRSTVVETGCVLTVGLEGAVREYLLFTASVTVTVTVAIPSASETTP